MTVSALLNNICTQAIKRFNSRTYLEARLIGEQTVGVVARSPHCEDNAIRLVDQQVVFVRFQELVQLVEVQSVFQLDCDYYRCLLGVVLSTGVVEACHSVGFYVWDYGFTFVRVIALCFLYLIEVRLVRTVGLLRYEILLGNIERLDRIRDIQALVEVNRVLDLLVQFGYVVVVPASVYHLIVDLNVRIQELLKEKE